MCNNLTRVRGVLGSFAESSNVGRVPREDGSITLLVTEDNSTEIQEILNGAKDGDTISLKPSLKIHPSKRLVIRRHVTIDGALNVNHSHSAKRAQFRCPRGDRLFLVK